METSYYPAFLKIGGKRCVVVGGGQVALRKVRSFLEHGASVEVISPELCAELNKLAESGAIRAVRRQYRLGDLTGAFIAIAATDNPRINLRVAKEASTSAVLVNIVDDAESSDFIVPSCLRRGDVAVAVSTGGLSPALARKIKTKLEGELGEEYASLVLLVDEVRSEVKRQGIKVDGDGWQKALDLDLIIGLLRKGEIEKARTALLNNLDIK